RDDARVTKVVRLLLCERRVALELFLDPRARERTPLLLVRLSHLLQLGRERGRDRAALELPDKIFDTLLPRLAVGLHGLLEARQTRRHGRAEDHLSLVELARGGEQRGEETLRLREGVARLAEPAQPLLGGGGGALREVVRGERQHEFLVHRVRPLEAFERGA